MEEHLEFTIDNDDAGKRIDKCIAMKLGSGYSRSQVKELIETGNITVDGLLVKPRHLVTEGCVIKVQIPEKSVQYLAPENLPLDILYEDEQLIVINKPAGMVVHPGSGREKGTLISALLYYLGELPESIESSRRPGVVHRLDKDTSGVMVVAKSEKALRVLSDEFRERTVKKTYVAVLSGNVEMDNGVVDAPLARQKLDRKKMGVEYSEGRPSRTVYHVLERFGDFTLVRLDLLTGRTHQIRVHMKHIGNPVAGDKEYGGKGEIDRQALHAETLGLIHPETKERMEFSAPMPEDMADFIRKLKKDKRDAGSRA
ncbi:MAG: RluA family pseudouridine synthase [Candidatus Omnitrophota bacterium]